MSDKRPGARDISDLKARLGLKKAKKPKGGVPTPGAALPAPPGAEPPAPTASTDPFGAMNVAAAQRAIQAAQAGPEIIVVEKGEAVESVDTKSKALGYLKIAGIIIAPLVVGIAVGQISSSAKTYNRTIVDAGKIHEDVKVVRKAMVPLQYAFLDARKRGFRPDDAELTEALSSVQLVEPNTTVVYKSWLYELDTTLVGDVLSFYAQSAQLAADLQTHLTLTKGLKKALLSDAVENLKKARPKTTENDIQYSSYRFGAYVEIPTQQDLNDPNGKKMPGVRIVEISAPICEDNKPSETGECPGPLKGYRYRLDPTGKWGLKELFPMKPGLESAAVDKLLLIQPTGVFEGLIKGNQPSVAEIYYKERVEALANRTDELIDLATFIEGKLKAKSAEGHKFTFFL